MKRSVFWTLVANFFWFAIKLSLGLSASSVFLVSSAIFTFALALSKVTCFIGRKKDERKWLAFSSLLIVLAGMSYAGYNVRLLMGFHPQDFGLITAIGIATLSFFLLVRSIVELVKARKSDEYEKNIKIIAFISALANIMLTQLSILAVEMPQMDQTYNVYFALGIGVFTIILGIWRMIRAK